MKIIVSIFLSLFLFPPAFAQEEIMDPLQKNMFDSLSKRLVSLENEIPRLQRTRAYNLYFKKQELEKTRFVYEYERLIFDEDLMQAEALLNAKTKAAIRRNDKLLIDYYENYHKNLIDQMKSQSERYQRLFEKEKNFKKELYKFINVGDEYNILRAARMVELAIKYARERRLEKTAEYLQYYQKVVNAEVFDFYSDFNLNQLTNSKGQFEKEINPLIESDSLSDILKAKEIVENCYQYSQICRTELNSTYFEFQKNMVQKAETDWYKRQGDQAFLDAYADQAVTAKRDSLNQKGIYRWREYIIVIDEMNPTASFKNVRMGEAIIDADKKLIEYIRVNRLAKVGKEVKVGPTELIPFVGDTGLENFHYNKEEAKWQYIICYTKVKNDFVTKKVNAYLPPLQFEGERIN